MARTPKKAARKAPGGRARGKAPSAPAKRKAAPAPPPPPAKAKRQRDYKKEYERRLAKGRAAGKTRQQARGHTEREHITRRQRERARVAAFAEQQAIRGEAQGSRSPEEIEELLWQRINGDPAEDIEPEGWGWFVKLEKRIETLHQRYVAPGNKYESLGVDMLEFADEIGLEPVELFYH